MDAGRHPNIEVLTNAEVVDCEGEPGHYVVRVKKHPRYVTEKCVACGLCVDVCPQVGGNEFDAGLMARKAIYRPFPQSVPSTYVIDKDACLNDKILVCGNCTEACDVDAIDFDMVEEEVEIDAGAVVVAVGFDEFDARKLGNYGYGRFPNVITSLELERLLNASGVTQGHVIRPSDHETPKNIVFVQCVGARGDGDRPYCSRFCCMNAVKDSLLIRQHDPEVEDITILHTDIRAFGKGFDDFVNRSKEDESAIYLRGRPSKIEEEENGDLVLFVEDTLEGKQKHVKADLVVLSVAAAPNDGAKDLADTLGIETDPYGFVSRKDPAVSAVETNRDGVYVAGSASGPQVIPDCVAQASAAAARAQLFLTGSRVEEKEEDIEPMDLSGPPRIGVMVCACGINIAGLLDVETLAAQAGELPDVALSQTHLFSCSSGGQDEMVEMVREHDLNRIVVAACTPRTHEPIFQESLRRVGFNPYLMEMVNIRDQCSWVHTATPEKANEKAKALIRMGVARARNLEPLHKGSVPMTRAAVVVGGGIAGIQAATDLAVQGYPVTLVEKADRLGGRLNEPELKFLYPNMRPAKEVLDEKIARLAESGARICTETEVEGVEGFVGNFDVALKGKTTEMMPAGAIILAFGADLYDPKGEFGAGEFENVITASDLEGQFCGDGEVKLAGGDKPKTAAFILCVGSRECDGFTGCSRYCCPTSIKQAIQLREQGVDVSVFYRDIRTISTGSEEMYRKARGMGVLFIRVPYGEKPTVMGNGKVSGVRSYDNLLRRTIEVPADMVVLATGMKALQPETEHFHDLLKPSLGLDGFFLERHPELAPVETSVEGVLVAGTVQGPKDIVDSVAQASAAAAKASVFLAYDKVTVDPAVAWVDTDKCRGCGTCADICDFQAPGLVEHEGGLWLAEINASLCKGCGTCTAWCPSGAIVARHFTDRQINSMIDAYFDVPLRDVAPTGEVAK
ncbi:MAG: FAD-dependent oxidoreductase [Planctomycetota bacterium]